MHLWKHDGDDADNLRNRVPGIFDSFDYRAFRGILTASGEMLFHQVTNHFHLILNLFALTLNLFALTLELFAMTSKLL